ncbi:MAG TPA: 30S ribosomal protein S1 [Candidatus Saccharimonadales bacterium]|nr:30S ribosomal protein S1 [Candidatus Saccharimonadales bacterium]
MTDETNQLEPQTEDPIPDAAEAPPETTEPMMPEATAPDEPETATAEAEPEPETATPDAESEPEPMLAEAESEPEPIAVIDAGPEPAEPAEPDEPMTMAQLLDDPSNEVKSLKHGDVVEGTVVRIDPDEILVDFGGKSEGVVSNRELMSRRGPRDGDEPRAELKVGDEVLVYVLQPESPEGHAVLSLRRAGLERKWRAMQERFDAGEIVEARVIDHNKGGLIVDLGVRGFVPISQIVDFPRRPRDEQPRDAAQEIAEKLQPFVGRTLRLKILEVNRKANRLILSEKVALYEERREKRDELFSSLQVGQRVQGTVRSIAPFGVFVDLGGIDGLVHKSELSWNKVNNPETAYAIGDEVEAEVIDINHERGRISLSIRRLQPDPWQESVAKYTIGDVISGTVTKLVNFGAFVRVEEGLEGLIHISELSNQRVAHPGDVVKEGDELKLKIISLDSERHRLGLSLKQADERPAAAAVAAPASTSASGSASPARFEDRPPRRERRDRRDRDYRPEDAISEPDEGIDNTMAAAFAESGLLDQFRASQTTADAAPAAPVETEPVAPEPVADVAAEVEAEAEAVADTADEAPAAPEVVTEPEVEAEPQAEPEPEPDAATETAAEEPAVDEARAKEAKADEPEPAEVAASADEPPADEPPADEPDAQKDEA